jgi:hypothetical protein
MGHLKTCYAMIKSRGSYGAETRISLIVDDIGSSASRCTSRSRSIRELR